MKTPVSSPRRRVARSLVGLGVAASTSLSLLPGAQAADGTVDSTSRSSAVSTSGAFPEVDDIEVTEVGSFSSPQEMTVSTTSGSTRKATTAVRDRFRVVDTRLPGEPGVVGLTWKGDAIPVVQVRVRTASGWQEWVDAEIDRGPDGQTGSTQVSFSGSAQKMQLRVSQDAMRPQATVVSSEVSASDRESASEMKRRQQGQGIDAASFDSPTSPYSAASSTRQAVDEPAEYSSSSVGARSVATTSTTSYPVEGPIIATRQMWGASEQDVTWTPVPSKNVQGVGIHHTVNANDYARSEVPALMRSLDYWMKYGRDWGGFGYNVVVDRFGVAWQGRAGHIADMNIGAHIAGLNTQTQGVSMLGTFTNVLPSANQWGATALTAAWELRANDVDPAGTFVRYSSYLKNGGGTFNTIVAHQDATYKDCPGYAVMGQWDRFMSDVRSFATKDLMATQQVSLDGDGSSAQAVRFSRQGFAKSTSATSTAYLSHWAHRSKVGVIAQLAAKEGRPVLLTGTNSVSAETLAELKRLGTTQVVLTESTSRVSEKVTAQLAAAGISVVRQATGGPISSSLEAMDRGWGGDSDTVVLANGDNRPADVLMASAVGAHIDSPVLSTTRMGVTRSVLNRIGATQPGHVVLVGGTDSIPSSAEAAIKAVSPGTVVERVGGSNRYETSAKLAERFWGYGGANDTVLLGSGDHGPGASTATNLAASIDGPVLYVRKGCQPGVVNDALRFVNSKLNYLGGDAEDTDYSAATTSCETGL